MISTVVDYAAGHEPESAADVGAIDLALALVLGYAWKRGPFALADAGDVERFAARLAAEGRPVSPLLERAAAQGGFFRAGRPLATGDGESVPVKVPPLVRDHRAIFEIARK